MRIDTAGRRKEEILSPAKEFFQQQFFDPTNQLRHSDEAIQHRLMSMRLACQESTVSSPNVVVQHQGSSLASGNKRPSDDRAFLSEACLHCFVSHAIEQVCVQLVSQFGPRHGFTREELYRHVLNGENPLRRKRRAGNSTYRSTIDTILESFKPDRGSLTTWTVRLVRRNPDLNSFLLERGVYLISDWAILNDTSVRQVRKILSEFHTLTEVEIQESTLLLEAYHAVYRQDRILQRQASGAVGRCPQPSMPQLDRMVEWLTARAGRPASVDSASEGNEPIPLSQQPFTRSPRSLQPNQVLGLLQSLAERIRQYRIYARGGPSLTNESIEGNGWNGTDLQVVDTSDQDRDSEEHSEFIESYREQFSDCMDSAIADTLERWLTTMHRKKSQNKERQFLEALSLFHERGMSMGEIAPLVGLKAQYQVSRLLKLKELRADIRQSLLIKLKDKVKPVAERFQSDLRDLQEVDRQIDEALSEQVDDVLKEAAAEASVAQKTTPTRSLYSRRLSQYLQTRSQKS